MKNRIVPEFACLRFKRRSVYLNNSKYVFFKDIFTSRSRLESKDTFAFRKSLNNSFRDYDKLKVSPLNIRWTIIFAIRFNFKCYDWTTKIWEISKFCPLSSRFNKMLKKISCKKFEFLPSSKSIFTFYHSLHDLVCWKKTSRNQYLQNKKRGDCQSRNFAL